MRKSAICRRDKLRCEFVRLYREKDHSPSSVSTEEEAQARRSASAVSFAPGPQSTDGEAANPGHRLRRRGPRSQEGRERRLSYNIARSLTEAADRAIARENQLVDMNADAVLHEQRLEFKDEGDGNNSEQLLAEKPCATLGGAHLTSNMFLQAGTY